MLIEQVANKPSLTPFTMSLFSLPSVSQAVTSVVYNLISQMSERGCKFGTIMNDLIVQT